MARKAKSKGCRNKAGKKVNCAAQRRGRAAAKKRKRKHGRFGGLGCGC